MASDRRSELEATTVEEERRGLGSLFDLGVELPIPPEMTRKVAGYIGRLEAELARLRWSEISESTTFTADKHYLLARRVGTDGRVDYSTLDGSDYQRPGVGYHLSHECAYFAFQEINAPAPPSTEPADREAL